MAKTKAQLKPPADLPPEGIDEWSRITAAAKKIGHEIKAADRSTLLLYCQTWLICQKAHDHVQQFGAVIKYANGVPGNSPQYKTYIETGKQLRGLLADLGCTPASRDFDKVKKAPDEPGDLNF